VSEQYVKELRTTFEHLIDAAQLDDHQREFLKLRWLDQLTWMESRAGKAQRFYYTLRLVTIIGAVVVPALVAAGSLGGWPGHAAQIGTWIVSLVVAISAAVEGFFQFGQRWRNYRSTVERLKTEGWLYLQLAGPYASVDGTHDAAYRTFASRIEDLIQKNVTVYITEVATEKKGSSGSADS
jgi:Protein of unknown function (DUF4231)